MLRRDTLPGTGRRCRSPRPSPRLIIALAIGALLTLLLACGGDPTLDDSLTNLEIGDCIAAPGADADTVDSVDEENCDEPNTLVVIERFEIGEEGDDYPGDEAVLEQTGAGCPITTIYTLYPTKDSWERVADRLVICFEASASAD